MKLLVFGLGYSAIRFVETHGDAFESIAGTVRLQAKSQRLNDRGLKTIVFEAQAEVERALGEAEGLLVSAPPDESGDPALARYGASLAQARQLRHIVYLSTIGVYGDRSGAWVDETSAPLPTSQRSRARLAAEEAWRERALTLGADLTVLRLAGIYGPGQNALVSLREGTARRILKPGQVFNRIHVADIGRCIAAVFARRHAGVLNVTDDEPAPPQDVIAFAAALCAMPAPAEITFDSADLSPMARSFYAENKRVSNQRLKQELALALLYPTYREGLRALHAAGEGG